MGERGTFCSAPISFLCPTAFKFVYRGNHDILHRMHPGWKQRYWSLLVVTEYVD